MTEWIPEEYEQEKEALERDLALTETELTEDFSDLEEEDDEPEV